MDHNQHQADHDPPQKQKRGPYMKYLDRSSGVNSIPRSTLNSRKKKALAAGNIGNPGNENMENDDVSANVVEPESQADKSGPSYSEELHSATASESVEVHSTDVFDSEGDVVMDMNNREKHVRNEGNQDSDDMTFDGDRLGDEQDYGEDIFEDEDSRRSSEREESFTQDEDSRSSHESEDSSHQNEDEDNTQGSGDEEKEKKNYIKSYQLLKPLHSDFPLSKLDVLLMILHLAIRHCHTQHFIEDQIKFVNCLFNSNVLDISYYIFSKVFPSSDLIQRHYFCDVCEIYLGSQFPENAKTTECMKCKKAIDVKSVDSKNYFITLSIREQIQNLLQRSDIELVPHNERQSQVISDIFDGELYRKCSQPESAFANKNTLTVTFNTDGVQIFKNQISSLWPILLHVNEIVPELRFKTENLIVGGLWFGSRAPNMALFLKPFIDELLVLSNDGVSVTLPNGSKVNHPVFAVCCSVDSVAKAKVVCQRQFNGGFSCLYCLDPNDKVEEDNTKLKHFDTTVQYPLRTEEEVVKDMYHADTLERAGELRKGSVRGFLGISILLMFSKLLQLFPCNPFNIVWGVVIDYLHATLEGVASDLLTLFKSILNAEQLKILNDRLEQITLSQGMTKRPRRIDDKIKYKAKEYRSFFLYCALPCLEDLLPPRNYFNLKLFVNALHTLLGDNITHSELQKVKNDLKKFVTGFESLYGLRNVTYNLHLCSHLVDQVYQQGPLWCYSNFFFESGNGLLGKLVKGTRSVINEIAVKFTKLQSTFRCLSDNPVSNQAVQFCSEVLGYNLHSFSEKIDGVSITGSYSYLSVKNQAEQNLLEQSNVPVNNGKITVCNRVIRNGIIYCSDSYLKAKTFNDSCVLLCDGSYGIIDKIVISENKELLCVIKQIRVVGGSTAIIPSIKRCSFHVFGNSYVTPFKEISRKCLFVSFDDKKHFVCHIPNFYERD